MSAVSANIITATTTATATATASKKVTVQGTAGTRHAEYNPIADSYLRANPKAVLTAIIHGVNAHCADMLITMLDIMADKYGHTVNDLIDTVKGDDRWKAVTEHPVLNSLGYFDQEDADRVVGKKAAASTTVEDLHDSVKSAKSAKVAKPTVAEAAAPVEEKPKVKKATKKAVVETVVETITHAQAYGIGDADIIPSAAAEPAPVKPKKAAAPAPAPVEEAPVKPKKAAASVPAPVEEAPVKAKKAAASVPAPVEEAHAKPKKAPKKAAAVDDTTVEALADSVAKLTTEEAATLAAAAAAPAKKKVVSKKPIAAKPA